MSRLCCANGAFSLEGRETEDNFDFLLQKRRFLEYYAIEVVSIKDFQILPPFLYSFPREFSFESSIEPHREGRK